MGWHMKLVICVQLAYVSVCLTREMSVVREWTSLDWQLSPGDGREPRRSITPSEIKSWILYKDRLLITLYRYPRLVYLNLTDNSPSPLLQRYPSWENEEDQYGIYVGMSSTPRVDRCDRLWLLDNVYNEIKNHMLNYLIVLDLKTDSILRKHLFHMNMETYLDVAVDDLDCENEYIYIQILDRKDGWTYSWAKGESWFHSWNNVTAMVLTPNGNDSIVYYNQENLSEVFYISTTHLRSKTSDLTGLERRRGLNVELATSAFDAKRDVLYYFNDDNKTVIHAVPCWTSERCSSNCQGDIDVGFDPTHQLKYITLDKNGDLWAVTSKSSFEGGEINFRLLSVPAIKSTCVESNANDTTNTSTCVESNAKDTTNTSTGVESNAKDTTDTSTGVESNTKDTTNTSTGVESNAKDTTNTSTGVDSNAKDTTDTSTGVESNTKDTTNTSTGVESNAKDTTNTSTGVDSNAKDTTNTTNINESTTPASSATEQTSTLGSVPKHTTVNIVDTTAGTPNSNIITQAVGGTNMPYLLFSFTNTTLNLSNFFINNFTYNNFH